ncbi:hypothetical protein GOBAR_AA32333 [Gossypium barbadense]|uniref:Uncharacterized protein n=1 Tax=Gossypium barbadense TaxID=3634 RepID=A0A2P5WB92_GOSBA|nr:hypothetical protein GOBAR_AA32333 [Gossypium barbadense]
MWDIHKFVWPHTYTSTRMMQNHRKFDAKTIFNCFKPIVKDMLTIPILVLIVELQEQFQYRMSYRKAWIAKQMAMELLYGDWDASYNKLHEWIIAMQEYVPGTVIEL